MRNVVSKPNSVISTSAKSERQRLAILVVATGLIEICVLSQVMTHLLVASGHWAAPVAVGLATLPYIAGFFGAAWGLWLRRAGPSGRQLKMSSALPAYQDRQQ